jgi:hypothetical protein
MSHGESDATGRVRVVRGKPSADELAALIAALRSRFAGELPAPAGREAGYEAAYEELTGYEAWRAGRLAALRADPRRPARPRPGLPR